MQRWSVYNSRHHKKSRIAAAGASRRGGLELEDGNVTETSPLPGKGVGGWVIISATCGGTTKKDLL